MTIVLPENLAAVINGFAIQRNTTVEALVVDALTRRFGTVVPPIPRDEWERKLFSLGIDSGAINIDEAARNHALSSDGLYE